MHLGVLNLPPARSSASISAKSSVWNDRQTKRARRISFSIFSGSGRVSELVEIEARRG